MPPLTSVATFVSWHRRAIAALCAGLAVYLLAHQLASPTRDGTPVAVLAHEVPAGRPLAAHDLELALLPTDVIPQGAYSSADEAAGQAPALPLPKGTVVHPALFATSRTIDAGRALVPISVNDERLLSVVRPGDRIHLVVGGGDFAEPISADARVSSVPTEDERGATSLGGGRGALMLVDVPETEAATVAMLGQSGQLGIVIPAP